MEITDKSITRSIIDGISGSRFGRLTVIRIERFNKSRTKVFCKCDCGIECLKRLDHLKSGASRSCGCLAAEIRIQNQERKKNGATIGGKQVPTYRIWAGMKKRCGNPNCRDFKDYGGRGIVVCDRWMDYRNFLDDMGEVPEGMTIERKNNDGDYEPNNCKWATRTEQNRNRRNVKLNELIAKKIRLLYETGMKNADISRETGVSEASISAIVRFKQWTSIS